VPRLGLGELAVETSELGVGEVLAEKGEPLARAGLDEAEEEKSVSEPASIRAGESEELLGVGVALVASEASAAREQALVDHPEVLHLLDREGTQPAYELVVRGISHDEREGGGGRFLLAMGVVVEEGVEVRHGGVDPAGRGGRKQHAVIVSSGTPPPFLTQRVLDAFGTRLRYDELSGSRSGAKR
jgi:hypothetical protein